ncbi:glycosyltransferase [Agromyces seonyuensis]|uniref:Glycosyltransferase n=1 Tax=Agromyces seonyuensis TaxID=2662446 RepID=A0A6I4NUE2_9MICO|nr:nucleotide disphospho-sugar-binding domain-containing protein [Agromyces seonyuensis]MWB97900.1 glycosyltransferase [Agromyces seonyuensis]
MAAILFCPVTFNLAETTRMIQVARALSPQHRAVFLGYEPDYLDLVRDAGFELRVGEPVWSPAERQRAIDFDQGRSLRSPFTRKLVAARVDFERALIREVGAVAVVTGSNLTSFLAARAEGVPLCYPVPFALTRPQVAQTRRMRFVDGEGGLASLVDRIATSAFRWIYNSAPLAPRAFASVAKANGVRPLRTVSALLEADRNLITEVAADLEGFTLPERYERVGPIFAHLDAPIPPLLADLAAGPRKVVYLGLGSSADRGLALAAARALGALDVEVVAPIGHYLRAGDAVPPNVHVTPLLPAHRLGGLVDAAVIHGGQGTVQTACATGIPFVGMGLQPEQTWHVRLCARSGNAIALSPKQVGTPAFVDAVRRVLTDPGIAAAAELVRQEYAGEDGAAAAARSIEGAILERAAPR